MVCAPLKRSQRKKRRREHLNWQRLSAKRWLVSERLDKGRGEIVGILSGATEDHSANLLFSFSQRHIFHLKALCNNFEAVLIRQSFEIQFQEGRLETVYVK